MQLWNNYITSDTYLAFTSIRSSDVIISYAQQLVGCSCNEMLNYFHFYLDNFIIDILFIFAIKFIQVIVKSKKKANLLICCL